MKPQFPDKPPSLDSPPEESNTALTTILTLLLLGGVLVGLVFVSLGSILGPLLLLLLVLPAIALFHYLLWGWWLGKAIERDANDDE